MPIVKKLLQQLGSCLRLYRAHALVIHQKNLFVAHLQNSLGSNASDAVVTVDGEIVRIQVIADQPVQVDEAFSEYARHVGSLQLGAWVYAVKLDADYPDGVYAAQIVIDSVSPMSFVLN